MEDLKTALMKALEDRKAKGGISLDISIKPMEEKKKELDKFGLAPEMESEEDEMKEEISEDKMEGEPMEMGSKMPDMMDEKDMASIDKSILGGEDPEEIVARLSARPKLSVQEGMSLKLAKQKLKEAEQSKLA